MPDLGVGFEGDITVNVGGGIEVDYSFLKDIYLIFIVSVMIPPLQYFHETSTPAY